MESIIPKPEGLRLLALDGGEIRAISQLRILDTLMHRINHERSTPLLPYQYFHLIIGTGTGGIIAILLVIFRLNAEEAMDAFLKIYRSVWRGGDSPTTKKISPRERSIYLKEAIYALLDTRYMRRDEKLLSETAITDSCLLCVCVASAADVAICRKFRNYHSQETQVKPTIVEAICATVAFPLLFEPVHVGPPGWEEEFVGCKFFFNNPTREALREACMQFDLGRPVAAIVNLGCGKALPISVSSTMNEKQYAALLEIVASDSEQVAEDLQRQIGLDDHSPYYRLSLDHAIGDMDSTNIRLQERIILSTIMYLEQAQGSHYMDRCVNACESPGRTTLSDLTQFREHLTMTGGLPPLSPFLVKREKQMQELEVYLFKESESVVVVSGLGGSGKTQLVTKFIRDFLTRLPIIIWVDATSHQTIRSSIVEQVRGLGQKCDEWKEGLRILSKWDADLHGRWLIVFDNADDASVRLVDYFPSHDQRYIIVTTRDERRKSISPFSHLRLESMSVKEAVQAFINAVFGKTPIDPHQLHEAEKIVDVLGCLPAAVIHAGCYIRDTNCLHDYISRLQRSRPKILGKEVGEQLDNYNNTVHQMFHVTMGELSDRARNLLFLLSCAHHAGFPRSLVQLAAQHHFRLEPCDFITRNERDMPELPILYAIFCPSSEWDAADFDELLEGLQRASLITIVPSGVHAGLLAIHPLLHAWVHEQLSSDEQQLFRAALARLLSCGAGPRSADLHEHLVSHIYALSPHWKEIHVNDRASFADLLAFPGFADHTVELWESVYKKLMEVYGEDSLEACQVARRLAWAYETQGDSKRAEEIHKKHAHINTETAAFPSREFAQPPKSSASLVVEQGDSEVLTRLERLRLSKRRDPEIVLEVNILEQIADPGQTFDPGLQSRILNEPKMKRAALVVASTFEEKERYLEAEILGKELIRARTSRANVPKSEVVWAQEYLSRVYETQGKYKEATPLRDAIYRTRCVTDGFHGTGTQEAIRRLSSNYSAQGRYREAEDRLRYLLGEANDAAAYRQSLLRDLEQLADKCEGNGDTDRAERLRSEFSLPSGGLLGRHTRTLTSSTSDIHPGPPANGEAIAALRDNYRQHSSLEIDTTIRRSKAYLSPPSARSTVSPATYGGLCVSESPGTYTSSPHSTQGTITLTTTKRLSPPLGAHLSDAVSDLEHQAADFERQGLVSRAAVIRRDIASSKSSEALHPGQ